ncbi:cold-shock protein [Aquibacillus koreensis]|uniref:Cold-shock protein n=1 Tax=Aquibacillus koreensis TaxID=279446 RepID=A0A9X4AKM5_9BACI|nr:cold-shock protein [Aquibacillus koreensis]MCT2537205.1 cold-shock protein [Aquibacillus koreensis]MDC3421553.1 cold-shock protein [Aquibacillus koreensis]
MAYYNNKREPLPEVETTVWACTSDTCPGWMRQNYSFEEEPACPLCKSEMVKEERTITKLD